MSESDVARALQALRRGEFVVVVDDATRENEGDLVLPAHAATPARLSFLLRHTAGLVCAPMTDDRADQLGLAPMVQRNTDAHQTAFTVSVDAVSGISTGISATDRATTLRLLADPTATGESFSRPGHIFPLRARPGGVLERRGHTEAAVDLALLAGIEPVMVICELTDDDGELLRGRQITQFSYEHDLPRITVQQIVDYRADHPLRQPEPTAAQLASTTPVPLPTRYGEFQASLWTDPASPVQHLVLTHGDWQHGPVPVRIHSECATGDLFGSQRCDCGEQLDAALRTIVTGGRGVLIYEIGHEGRGIGLRDKLRAYGLQDSGADTVEANELLGHPADSRDYRSAVEVLRTLGIEQLELLTNNPDKVDAVRAGGLSVRRRSLVVDPHPSNLEYLRTKVLRMGHQLALSPVAV